MSGCVYRTADNQCQKYSDPVRNTMSWCVDNEPCEERTPSNADRIRGMTDEELADFMEDTATWGGCPNHGLRDCTSDCGMCWIVWLKSPVEERG